MSIFKSIVDKRFWVSVAAAAMIALLLGALGAWLAAGGILKKESINGWICVSWAVTALIGGRSYIAEGNGNLWRCILVAGTTLAIFWCVGASASEHIEPTQRLCHIGMLLVGAFVAAMLPKKKKRRSKRDTRGKREGVKR